MTRDNRELNYAVQGTSARDLEVLIREWEQQPQQDEQPVRRHHPERQVQTQTRRHAAAKKVSSPLLVGSIVTLCTMVMVLLFGYVQLTKVSANVTSIKNEISELTDEHVSLLTSYEKTFDLATVKQVAEEAGMSKPNAGQIEYIDISGADNAVVYRAGGGKLLNSGISLVKAGALQLWEYFR